MLFQLKIWLLQIRLLFAIKDANFLSVITRSCLQETTGSIGLNYLRVYFSNLNFPPTNKFLRTNWLLFGSNEIVSLAIKFQWILPQTEMLFAGNRFYLYQIFHSLSAELHSSNQLMIIFTHCNYSVLAIYFEVAIGDAMETVRISAGPMLAQCWLGFDLMCAPP